MAKHWSGSPNVDGPVRNPGGRAPAPRSIQNSSGNAKNGTKSRMDNEGQSGFKGLGKPARNALKK